MDSPWRAVFRLPDELFTSPDLRQFGSLTSYPLSDFAGASSVGKVTVHWTDLYHAGPRTFAFPPLWTLTHLEIQLHDYASHNRHPPLSAVLGAIMSCREKLRVFSVAAAVAHIEPSMLAQPVVTFPVLESLTLKDQAGCLALLIAAPKMRSLCMQGHQGEGLHLSEEQMLYRLKTLLDRSSGCPHLRSLILYNPELDRGDLPALLGRLPALTDFKLEAFLRVEATPLLAKALTRDPACPATLAFLPALANLAIRDTDNDAEPHDPIVSWMKAILKSRQVPLMFNGVQLACLDDLELYRMMDPPANST